MKRMVLPAELHAYEQAFTNFVQVHNLPAEWFAQPDHLAIKCADSNDYAETCREVIGMVDSEGIWELTLDGRLLGSGGLSTAVRIAGHEFKWIEIMQPRPGKGLPRGFVEHTEFLFTDFDAVTALLAKRGLTAELQQNPGHRWLNIVIDDSGREIKLNDKVLADVVLEERAQGLLRRKDIE